MTPSLITSLRIPAPVISLGARRSPVEEPHTDVPLDVLDIRDAVLGDGVVLHRTDDGALVLHAVTAGRTSLIGRFNSAADAWRAIDALDLAQAGL